MKRIVGLLMLGMWLAAVTWYWWANVPLAATRTAQKPANTQVCSLTPSGDLPLVHLRFTNGSRGPVTNCRPMEFWRFPECRKVRELFDQNDEIIAGPLYYSREVLIRRDGRLRVVNSESGETIGELPDVLGVRRFAVLPGNRQVLIDDNRDIHLYEFGQETPRWTASQMRLRGPAEGDPIVGDLVTVAPRSQKNSGLGSGTAVLSLDTGKLDPRFDHLGRLNHIRLAPNGRFALVTTYWSPATRTPERAFLCDIASGEVLWTFPGVVVFANHPTFNADGDEVLGYEMAPEKRLKPACWSSLDGSPLPLPPPQDLMRLRYASADGRFIVRRSEINGSSLANRAVASINNFAARYRLGFSIMNFRTGPALLEVETGHVVGPLPDNPGDTNFVFLRDRPALVCATLGEISYYELPARRNSQWLVGWALVPPLSLAAILQFWKGWRLRRSTRRVERPREDLAPNAQPGPLG